MDQTPNCAVCGSLIEAGEAWMTSEAGDRAHAGCVYRDLEPAERDRWMPPE